MAVKRSPESGGKEGERWENEEEEEEEEHRRISGMF